MVKNKILAGIILAVIALASYEKIIFAFRLVGASFTPAPEPARRDRLFAEYFLKNKALRGSTGLEERRSFLIPFAEFLLAGSAESRDPDALPLRQALVREFPENPLFDAVGLYQDAPESADWENLDALSLGVLSNPDFNDISCKAITASARKGRFSRDFFEILLDFLIWRKNDDLSRRLFTWARDESFIGADFEESLSRDIDRIKGSPVSDGGPWGPGGDRTPAVLSPVIARAGLEMSAGRNLVREAGLGGIVPLEKSWDFSDMSDGGSFAGGSFIGGADGTAGDCLRIMCFSARSEKEKEDPRAGFWHRMPLPLEDQSYLLRFRYRTRRGTERPSFYIQYAFDREWMLEETASAWREVYLIFNNKRRREDKINFLFRMWGPGSVWFDQIGFYALGEDIDLSGDHLLFVR